jgi:hypothetical protein
VRAHTDKPGEMAAEVQHTPRRDAALDHRGRFRPGRERGPSWRRPMSARSIEGCAVQAGPGRRTRDECGHEDCDDRDSDPDRATAPSRSDADRRAITAAVNRPWKRPVDPVRARAPPPHDVSRRRSSPGRDREGERRREERGPKRPPQARAHPNTRARVR